MKSCSPEELLELSAKALGRLAFELGDAPAAFGLVAPEARPFLAALLAHRKMRRCWVVCATVQEQEHFGAELAQWHPEARIFPELPEWDESTGILHDPETASERLEILALLETRAFQGPLVIHATQIDGRVPPPGLLTRRALRVASGEVRSIAALISELEALGYERSAQTAFRGQFSARGGIVDIFSWHAPQPVRIEFDDQTIESLRAFDPDSQISTGALTASEILPRQPEGEKVPLGDLISPEDLVLSAGTIPKISGAIPLRDDGESAPEAEFFPSPFSSFGAGELVLDVAKAALLRGQLATWRDAGWRVAIAAGSAAEAERFLEFAQEDGFDGSWIEFLPLALAHGFVHPAARLAILSDAALFGRAAALRALRLSGRRHRAAAARAAMDFSEFEPGDPVVHTEHGVGIFEGFVPDPDGREEEVLAIRYAGEARLYVPVSQAWQVARYAGLGKRTVELSELGGRKWSLAKQKATASVFDYAARMLRVQAERESLEGHAFGPDTSWQREFEEAFLYTETPDQARAIAESKKDMESARPMDRLVCGDVGFGKTEVAIRAVFKAVLDGKQAAILAPTTVLAAQHFRTLRERMSDYPIRVELLSRHRTAALQRKVLDGLRDGSVDVVTGTHRLLSPDVHFKDLGLIVVDEEQRFGVRHKDLLKERFRQVDILTLSATPIPRTLYMALSGARDMSLIETPPPNRQAVETVICAYDERIFRDAIHQELARGGQVFFLHNRVRTIEKVAARIRTLCPEARVVVGHGQMGEGELEPVMTAFVEGRADVLVSTTIIESGLDIPNANTIIVDRADLFGLADLYQLRGRVGRAGAKARAFLMLPRDLMGGARKRVSAIKRYSELGSGFKIAMRDLELRGAGNLLGTAQSGHILAVGFDLYCRMLKRAVETLSGRTRFCRAECAVHADFLVTSETLAEASDKPPAFLPSTWIPETRARIACHRQLAEAEDAAALDALEAGWRDRFGPVPPAAANALLVARIAAAGSARRISSIEVREGRVMIQRRKEFHQPGGRFPRLTGSDAADNLREILRLVEELPLP